MYRYDNYTDSFIRIDGEPNTGSTTVRVGVPIKEAIVVKKVELTDDCINKIADAVVRKLADRKTEPQRGCDADCNEDCTECAKETELWKAEQTEPQTDCSWKKGE